MKLFNYITTAIIAVLLFVTNEIQAQPIPPSTVPLIKPTVSTASISTFDGVSATMGGSVTSDGGATVSEYGVVYNTSGTPTTSDSKVQIGTGTGTFSQSVSGLTEGTTYYVRAYAINSVGTSYGGEESFTTLANSAPSIANAPVSITVTEDVLANVNLSGISVSDSENDLLTVTLSVGSGTFATPADGSDVGAGVTETLVSNDTITLSGSASDITSYLQTAINIQYTGALNANGTAADTLTIIPNDGTEDGTSVSVKINITAVNDDPTIAGLPSDITVTEDVVSNVDLSAATLGDVDSEANSVSLTIITGAGILTASSGGGVTISGSGSAILTLSGTVSNIDTYLNTASNIKYTSASNANGNNATTLTLKANDGGNTGTGGGNDVALGTVNVDITAVNDIPTIVTNNGLKLNEGATKVIPLDSLEANDVDDNNSTLTYTITTAPARGQLENSDNPGVSILSFTQQQLMDGKINYVHDDSNTASDGFTFKVADGQNGELSGQVFSITIVAIDDDTPTIVTNNGLKLNEGASATIPIDSLEADDADTDNTTLTYTITTAPAHGQLENSDNPGVSILSFTQQQLIDGKISYVHDDSNTTSDEFIFKVADGTPNELTNQKFSITIVAVDDDAPTIVTNNGLKLNEGASAVISLDSLEADDTDTDNTTLTFTITTGPVNGQLENSDNPGVSILSFTQQQLIDGKISYVHDDSNTTSDEFIFKVADGTPNELTNQKFSITIVAVDDDAPVLTVPSDISDYADADQCGTVINFESEIMDVSQPSFTNASSGAVKWQSFRAEKSGTLTKLQLFAAWPQTFSFHLIVYEGVGATGEILYSDNYSISLVYAGWFDLNIPKENAPLLVEGNDYTFSLNEDNSVLVASNANPYEFGMYCNTGDCAQETDWDLSFNTFITEGVFTTDDFGTVELKQTEGLASGSVFPIGETINTFVATDGVGNKTQKSFKVTVNDNIAPVVMAKDTTIYLNVDGIATISVESVDDGSYDNCNIDTMYLSQDTFDCSYVGYISGPEIVGLKSAKKEIPEGFSVLLTAKDSTGNIGTDWFYVVVKDTVSPEVKTKDITVYLDDSGVIVLDSLAVDDGSRDKCGLEEFELSRDTFSCEDIGENKVYLKVTDVNGNFSIDSALITVVDELSPDVYARDTILYLDANGLATLEVSEVDDGSTDNCGIDTMYLSQDTFDCRFVDYVADNEIVELKGAKVRRPGGLRVSLTAQDLSGNLNADLFYVTVKDTIAPEVITKDITVSLDINGEASITPSDIDNGSFDACGIELMELSKITFSSQDTGINVVILTVTDVNGNSAQNTATVTIADTIAPVASCKDITVQIGDTYIIRDLHILDNGSYDNDEIASMSIDKDTFSCADVGVNIVTLVVTDNSGNQSTCESRVTVVDVDVPVFQSIDDIDIQLEAGKCDTAITYPELIVDDNCEVTLTLLEGIGPDGGAFPIGTSVETWEAKDLSGNADTVSFSVTVLATNSLVPVIDAIDDLTLDNDEEVVEVALKGIYDSGCTIDSLMVTASTTDNTIISSLSVNYVNLSSSGLLTIGLEKGVLGSATVTVRVENNEGGVTEVDFVIHVTEINDVPVLTYPVADQTVNTNSELRILLSTVSGEYFTDLDDEVLTLTAYEEGSTELPGWATMSGDTLVSNPTIADTGCVTIVVEASDAAGAIATDTFIICVEDYMVGIDEVLSPFNMKMYPNPTSGKVNVDFENTYWGDTEIMIYTISGEEVFRKVFRYDSSIQLDLSDKVSGIYLVRIIQGSEIQNRKLILDKK